LNRASAASACSSAAADCCVSVSVSRVGVVLRRFLRLDLEQVQQKIFVRLGVALVCRLVVENALVIDQPAMAVQTGGPASTSPSSLMMVNS
jgi:hypothetical protein